MTSLKSYSEVKARIQLACQSLSASSRPNIAAVAREFDVSQWRFRRRLKGCQSRSEPSSVNRKLSEDEELGIYLYLKCLDEIGVPARLSMVSNCANSILQKCHAKDDINPAPTISSAWSKRFLSRHPEFHIRKQKTIEHDRKNVHDPDLISALFACYKSLCKEKGIQKEDTYNFDETSFRVEVGKDQ